MKISVIIPVKPGGDVAALAPLRQLDADSPDYEVIVAEGRRPSRQRNAAVAAARGEILYFLDDDAVVPVDALKHIASAFSCADVAAIGGPSITPAEDTVFQRAIAYALSSVFGGGAIRNRYRRYGVLRDTDDRELILCNLAIRKEVYLEYGGLDERLYPNEENELIDRLIASGLRLLHDPDMYVTRSQRPTVKAYIRQMLTYGRGRAEQTLLSRSLSFKAVIPALFSLYLLSLPFFVTFWYAVPAFAYLSVLCSSMLAASFSHGIALALRLPVVYTVLHFCYGSGFLLGLIRPRYRTDRGGPMPVKLRREMSVGAGWDGERTMSVASAI